MEQPPLFSPPSLSVSELTYYLRQLFESDDILRNVWVQGEVSNLSRPSSGHIYFTLKDAAAALRCVIWRTNAQRMRVDLQNGQAVEAHGYISLYERDGQYQLYIDTLRAGGAGWLYQEFLRLKARLEEEGLFDQERKRPLPVHPRRIGIVTSPTGAALQDMLNTLQRRYPLVEVILAPAAVQGDEAPAAIAAALASLGRLAGLDVILVARGGGSLEDLWAFNDERVVRAIAASPVPVVTGIGHETDFTLADFAADLRAPTPTGAAVQATPDVAELKMALGERFARLDGLAGSSLAAKRRSLDEHRFRLARLSPRRQIQNDRQRLDEVNERALRGLSGAVTLRKARLDGARQRLAALDPLAVLRRGYALLQSPDGRPVTSVTQVKPLDSLRARLTDGGLTVQVQDIQVQPKQE